MGDPRKLRKKYSTPSHPWQKLRIDEEKILMTEFGFKNKKELWKLSSKLRGFKSRVKKLIPLHDPKSEDQKAELLLKLQNFDLVGQTAVLEDILGITLNNLCERRLSTIVYKKGLARSIRQARQFITHEHILLGERKITFPSYLVTSAEELMITFADNSSLKSEDHPERLNVEKEIKKEMKEAGLKPHEEKKPAKATLGDDETEDIVLEEPIVEEIENKDKIEDKTTEKKPVEEKKVVEEKSAKKEPIENKETPKVNNDGK